MVSVSDHLKDEWIAGALDQLDNEKSLGIELVEFARTVVDRPDNFAKISNSFAGFAADLQIRCTLKELQLWCNRIWDKQAHSLPNLANRISEKAPAIKDARLKAYPDWSHSALGIDKLESQIAKWKKLINEIASGDLVLRMRERRDEHFAHLLLNKSGTRKTRQRLGIVEGYSFNEVLAHAGQTLELLSEAYLIWNFHQHDIMLTRRTLRVYYEAYWKFIPNFSEIESKQ